MPQRFLGIDFGWAGKPSGLAALAWDGEALRLTDLCREADLEKILAWVDEQSPGDTLVGVDAPLVIPNLTGMRDADKLAHSRYGKYHAGAYPASQARDYWERTTGLSRELAARGFLHGDGISARAHGRFQIEVYPHAAVVQLFGLDRIVKYKRGVLAARREGLATLRELLLKRLPGLVPRLALTGLPEIPTAGPALKALEDQLDAITSAYVAAFLWYWGPERTDVLGDSKRGYIVVPKRTIAGLRENYSLAGLLEADLDPDPLMQFERWFQQARDAGLKEPNAMTLATATSAGVPSARVVLLKGLEPDGFVWYTNRDSRKGLELRENPRASLGFYWAELERQVRIEGEVTEVSREESEGYYHSRPRGSQLGAWASHQSEVVAGREVLEARMAELETRYVGQTVPLPPFWGGFRLRPCSIEFWQGRPSRLHDRLRYVRSAEGPWRVERLSP